MSRLRVTERGDRAAFATRPVAVAERGMVAAAHPAAVEIGLDVLRSGGTAVDAAIATNAALALVEPTACGLGGDLFAMVLDPATGTLVGLNGSGRAPAALSIERADRDADGTIPLWSPHTWTVPGCVDGWFALHGRFGRLPVERLLAPVVDAARAGVEVPPVIAGSWSHAAMVFADRPGFRETFMPGGAPPRAGERFCNPALAATLERIARGGRAAFYEGTVAGAISSFARAHGGLLSEADLAAHASEWVAPLSTTYRGVTLWELPPNGQGLAALQMLDIVEAMGERLEPDAAARWHLLVEAKKLAYEDRARFYADPAFVRLPIEGLLHRAYARERARLVDPRRASIRLEAGRPRPAGETTILVAADGEGMMVSLIQSNYTGFGSGHVVAELGFGLQNRGALFALDPAHPNALAPGKRPFHTIIPAFLGEQGIPRMAFGLMGGDMQAQGHAQIVVNLVDLDMDIQEAGDAPRFHHTGSSEPTGTIMMDGGVLHLEPGVPSDVVAGLRVRGHRIEPASTGVFGGYQAILRDQEGLLHGASESRKDGLAAGC